MSYAATVIKLYPPVISSHPASFQLLLLLWHLTLPGVLLPYCDTILCCPMLFPLVFKNVFSCIYALKSNLSFPRQTVINILQSLVIFTPFAADGEYFRQSLFNTPQCIIIAVTEIYIFLYFLFFQFTFLCEKLMHR